PSTMTQRETHSVSRGAPIRAAKAQRWDVECWMFILAPQRDDRLPANLADVALLVDARLLLQNAVGRTGGWRHDQAGSGDLKRDAEWAGLDEIEVLTVCIAVRVQERAGILAQGHDVETRERPVLLIVGKIAEQTAIKAAEGLGILVMQRAQGLIVGNHLHGRIVREPDRSLQP